MIRLGTFRAEMGRPIYLQIIKYLKPGRGLERGGGRDELPLTPGALGALGTQAEHGARKACRMLEEEGLLVSRPGRKSCVRVTRGCGAGARGTHIRSDAVARPRPCGAWECRWRESDWREGPMRRRRNEKNICPYWNWPRAHAPVAARLAVGLAAAA